MPLVDINGVNINYQDEGEGRPIILIHGFSFSLESWDEQMPALLNRYRVIRYDCRGHGKSDSPADPALYSQEILVEETLGLMDHLELEKVYLCGLSMGGNVALHLALNYPHRVEALIMVCTGSGSNREDGFIDRFIINAEILDKGNMDIFAEAMLSAPSFSRFVELRPDLIERNKKRLAANNARGLANTIRGVQMKRPPITTLGHRLNELQVPSLILVGDEDMPCLGPARFMDKEIPNCRLVVFPQTGHIINLERPDDFNRETIAFLEQVKSDAV